jgi:potassium uptake Trk family protein
MIYPNGGIAYIDALFFCSGSATQSGLNTIDLNKLNTYQQFVIFLIPMFCNPITINTIVVFIRLYWFEKRFQNIVNDARLSRGLSRSRGRTQDQEQGLKPHVERGVDGRHIVVLHRSDGTKEENGVAEKSTPFGPAKHQGGSTDEDEIDPKAADISPGSEKVSSDKLAEKTPITFHRDIQFAELARPERIPLQQSEDQHIAFLENQRNPKDDTALRIPGPRESDQGSKPISIGDTQNAPSRQTLRDAALDEEPEDDTIRKQRGLSKRLKSALSFDETARPPRMEREEQVGSKRINRFPSLDVGVDGLKKRAKSFLSTTREEPTPYLSYIPTIGRNSAFVDLTEDQREELGGIEYRSLKTLAAVLVFYFIGWSLFGVICLVPFILKHDRWGQIVEQDGQGRVWWAIFTSQSSFNDLGFTLTPDSMNSFADSTFVLLVSSFLIIIGNTGFPCMLRFLIWVIFRLVPYGSKISEELHFLLDHPRRCFTLMFPSKATWWLFWILVMLNGIDLMFFIVLDVSSAF